MVFALSAFGADEVSITILHTTDLHSSVQPAVSVPGSAPLGGIARCATEIRRIRAENRNVLLLDLGDLFQGGALGWLTQGRAMIQAINLLHDDAWILGNHEFDWGLPTLADRIHESQVPVLAANMGFSEPSPLRPEIRASLEKIRPFLIREFDGVKVGIVGLTTPGIPNWSRPNLLDGVTFEDSVAALRRVIPQMKAAGCQILILGVHQGIREQGDDHANQIFAIARAFPEIDVILGAHTHQAHAQQMVQNVLYSQAGFWGSHLGRVDLVFDRARGKLRERRAHLIPMDDSIPRDAELLAALAPALRATDAFLAAPIGEAAERLDSEGAPKRATPIFNLLCAAIAGEIQSRGGRVDAVLHGVLNEQAAVEMGPIRGRDLYALVPYENTIGVARLTRGELLEVLEENATAYRSPRFRGLWGLTMKLRPSAPEGKRVLFLGDREGRSLAAEASLRVAFNSYDLASGGDRWKRLREIISRPGADLVEYDFQTRDAVQNYIQHHSPLRADHTAWWTLEKTRL